MIKVDKIMITKQKNVKLYQLQLIMKSYSGQKNAKKKKKKVKIIKNILTRGVIKIIYNINKNHLIKIKKM